MATKRVNVTLPIVVYDQLEQIAEQQGRSLAGLLAFISELCLTTGYGLTGATAPNPNEVPKEQQVLMEFILTITSGQKPTAATLLMTAKLTGLQPDVLAKLIKINGHDEHEPANSRK